MVDKKSKKSTSKKATSKKVAPKSKGKKAKIVFYFRSGILSIKTY